MKRTALLLLLLVYAPSAFAEPEQVDGPGPEEQFRGGHGDEVSAQPWWTSFADPTLDALIREGLRTNRDVAAAQSRVEAATARVGMARAPLLPTLTFDASASASPSDSLGFGMGGGQSMGGVEMPAVIGNGSAMFNLGYQIDVWGRQVLAMRASQSQEIASEHDLDALAMSLTVQIGEAYLDVITAQQQAEVIERQILLQQSLLELLEAQFEVDQSEAVDVLQQRQQVASAQARLPGTQANLRTAHLRLQSLVPSSQSGGAAGQLSFPTALPALPPAPPTGTPSQLTANRASIRAAQARLEATEQQLSSQNRSFLPTLGVNAQGGTQFFWSEQVDQQPSWSVGVTLSVPIFRGLSDVSSRQEAQASRSEAEASLDQAILQAATEVETALANEQGASLQLQAYEQMLQAAEQAYTVARNSYAQGSSPYLSVMTALSQLQQAELNVISAQRTHLSARLQLHQALGGAWTEGLGSSQNGGEIQ